MRGRTKRPSVREMELECELWNAKHPVGTRVVVRMDNGEKRDTVTTSVAQMLSGHAAVIWLEAISGCYLLSRVKVVTEVTA